MAVIVAPSRPPDDPGAKSTLGKVVSTVWLPVFSATALVLALILFVAAAAPCAWSATTGAAIVHRAALGEGVDPVLAMAIGHAESRLRCDVPNSTAGAVGIMQVLPLTAESVGVGADALATCEGSARAGVRYLKLALAVAGGDEAKAAHLYFTGLDAVPNPASPYARAVMEAKRRLTPPP